MPCNSEYMNPSKREEQLSQVACLLAEINGAKWREADWQGYHPKVYCKNISDQEADQMVAQLCEFLQNHDVTKFSLEMQMWWRDHRRADKQRLEEEVKKQRTKVERDEALRKLTPYERKLLGLD